MTRTIYSALDVSFVIILNLPVTGGIIELICRWFISFSGDYTKHSFIVRAESSKCQGLNGVRNNSSLLVIQELYPD